MKPCSAWARGAPLTLQSAPSGPGCDPGPDHRGHRSLGGRRKGICPQPAVRPMSGGSRASPWDGAHLAHREGEFTWKCPRVHRCALRTPGNSGPLYPFWTTTRRPPWARHVVACRARRNLALTGGLALWRPSGRAGAAELPSPGSGESLLGWEGPPGLAGGLGLHWAVPPAGL